MKERPILFSGPMVRAILEGRKSVTRRVVKPQPACGHGAYEKYCAIHGALPQACPYGQPGDRLWVRETWGLHRPHDKTDWFRGSLSGMDPDDIIESWEPEYRADWGPNDESAFWRPSIFMPRWASRISLEVTGIRVERLQDISERDATAEGFNPITRDCKRPKFIRLWEDINGAGSWDANPWVWVIEFRRVDSAVRGEVGT